MTLYDAGKESMNVKGFLANLRQQKHPLRFLSGVLLYRSGACRFFKVRHADFVIPFHRYSHAMQLWVDPESNQEDFAFLRSYLKAGDAVIDVGANIGLMALAASQAVGTDGRVLAVEPHPRTFQGLLANVRANGRQNIVPENAALGIEAGTLQFQDLSDDTANRVLGPGEGSLEVRVVRLDDLARRHRFADGHSIALLKIDAEGYERMVLDGATETLARTRCVYFEAADWLTNRFGYPASAIFEVLREHGFHFLRVDGVDRFSHFEPARTTEYGNYLAIRDFGEFAQRARPIVIGAAGAA